MQNHPDVLAGFQVEIKEPLPDGTQLFLEWVDPLSSYELTPEYIPMISVDNKHFSLDVPVKKGQLLQYRYVAMGTSTMEEISIDGKPLPSRFFYITDHSQIQDSVLGFSSSSLKNATNVGIIEGFIHLKGNGHPAKGLIISSAGLSATTNADGKFRLAGIPTGTQNITVFSPDGSVEPLQQQAVIAENIITPVNVSLAAREMVNVTFLVNVPRDTPKSAELKIFGNLSQLGNSYAGLFGGSNITSNLTPILSRQSNNTYFGVIQVPAGTELRYLYSLGDTFWNRELDENNGLFERTVFIGKEDMEFEDKIASWGVDNKNPIHFLFVPPTSTLPTDLIQIQFNVYSWMEPIEMRPMGDGSYEFILFNPLNFSTSVEYRFCRSHMCGLVEKDTNSHIHTSFKSGDSNLTSVSSGQEWVGWNPIEEPTIVTTEDTEARHTGFNTVVELADTFRPGWMVYIAHTMDAIVGLNANTVIIPVTQTFRGENPVWLNTDPGRDPSARDIQTIVSLARERGLKVYLLASIKHKTSSAEFWNNAVSNPVAWKEWFDNIQDFYLSVGTLAKSVNADGLILGDEEISSIITESNNTEALRSSYPADAYAKWNDILVQTKNQFGGKTLLGIHYDDFQFFDVNLLEPVDGIYLLNLGRISDSIGSIQSYSDGVAKKLDDVLGPALMETGKLVWIGLDFPSIESSYTGCVELSGRCQIPSVLNFPAPFQPELKTSHDQQTALYNASLPEENRRPWITGVVSRRFNILGNYQDQSASVRGKPAADVVWYWFSTMTGIPTH